MNTTELKNKMNTLLKCIQKTELKKEKVRGYIAYHENCVVFLDARFMPLEVIWYESLINFNKISSAFVKDLIPKINDGFVLWMFKNNGIPYIDGRIIRYIEGSNYMYGQCTSVDEFLYECDFEYKSSDYVRPADGSLDDHINYLGALIYLD